MISILLECVIILIIYASFWFIISIFIKRNDFADIAWGLGYVLLCAYLFSTQPLHPVAGICYLLVSLWGLRLSIFLFFRNIAKTEDFRYLQWRKEWGSSFYFRSFLQVYLLQAFFLLVIISPILFASSHNESEWSLLTTIGLLAWCIGFYWQIVGDQQLRQFIKQRKDREEVLKTGLWKYSRHPNYFGEVLMWWSIYLIIFPLSGSLIFIIGPLTITILIRFVSGVPMLEKRYAENKAYQDYKERVPALFPNFWVK